MKTVALFAFALLLGAAAACSGSGSKPVGPEDAGLSSSELDASPTGSDGGTIPVEDSATGSDTGDPDAGDGSVQDASSDGGGDGASDAAEDGGVSDAAEDGGVSDAAEDGGVSDAAEDGGVSDAAEDAADDGGAGDAADDAASDAAVEACVPIDTCPTEYICGSIADGCGGQTTCGACLAGETCTAEHRCQQTTVFFYDSMGRLVGEYETSGAPRYEVAYMGATPLAVMTPSEVQTVHADHLGTPRALANATDKIVWRWDGDAFGASLPDEDPDGDAAKVSFPMRFPGQVYDEESGLHYNYFRDYDPSVGRYLQADPIGLVGGVNLYGYVGGAPVSLSDPSGLLFGGRLNAGEGRADAIAQWAADRQMATGNPLYGLIGIPAEAWSPSNSDNTAFNIGLLAVGGALPRAAGLLGAAIMKNPVTKIGITPPWHMQGACYRAEEILVRRGMGYRATRETIRHERFHAFFEAPYHSLRWQLDHWLNKHSSLYMGLSEFGAEAFATRSAARGAAYALGEVEGSALAAELTGLTVPFLPMSSGSSPSGSIAPYAAP